MDWDKAKRQSRSVAQQRADELAAQQRIDAAEAAAKAYQEADPESWKRSVWARSELERYRGRHRRLKEFQELLGDRYWLPTWPADVQLIIDECRRHAANAQPMKVGGKVRSIHGTGRFDVEGVTAMREQDLVDVGGDAALHQAWMLLEILAGYKGEDELLVSIRCQAARAGAGRFMFTVRQFRAVLAALEAEERGEAPRQRKQARAPHVVINLDPQNARRLLEAYSGRHGWLLYERTKLADPKWLPTIKEAARIVQLIEREECSRSAQPAAPEPMDKMERRRQTILAEGGSELLAEADAATAFVRNHPTTDPQLKLMHKQAERHGEGWTPTLEQLRYVLRILKGDVA